MNRDEIWETYETMLDATHALYLARVAHVQKQEAVDWQRWQAVAEGTITGKNEQEREANLRMLLMPQYEALAEAARDLAGAQCDYEMVKWEIQRINVLAARLPLGELPA